MKTAYDFKNYVRMSTETYQTSVGNFLRSEFDWCAIFKIDVLLMGDFCMFSVIKDIIAHKVLKLKFDGLFSIDNLRIWVN